MSSRLRRVSFKFMENLHRLSRRLLLGIHPHEDIISQERRGTSGTQIERSRKHENYFKWFHFIRVNCERAIHNFFPLVLHFVKVQIIKLLHVTVNKYTKRESGSRGVH